MTPLGEKMELRHLNFDANKMMSFIKTSNQIALKVQHPLCLHKNLPLVVDS